jgi:serine/threonine-protein kinase RIO1
LKFKRVHRAIYQGKATVAAAGISDIVVSNLQGSNMDKEIPYSETQIAVQEWTERNRRRLNRVIAAAPVSTPVAVGAHVLLTGAELLSYAVGSYDMATPEIRRYEESLTLSGMTSRVL